MGRHLLINLQYTFYYLFYTRGSKALKSKIVFHLIPNKVPTAQMTTNIFRKVVSLRIGKEEG